MAFPPLGNSDHVFVSVSNDFPLNSKRMPIFTAQLLTILMLIGMVFMIIFVKVGASAAATEFSELVQAGIDTYILRCRCQVKPHSSPWFTVPCAAVIAHGNYLFHLNQQSKSSASKVNPR